jgi:dephospho-CoA kinase
LNLDIDIIIGVTAPEQIRIERVMQRIGCSKDEVIKRMQQQMPEDEKMKKCNYIIHNDNVTALIPQVLQIHEKLLNFK